MHASIYFSCPRCRNPTHTLESSSLFPSLHFFSRALRSTAPFDSALFVNNLPTRHRQLYLPPSNHTLHNPLQPVPKAHRFLTRNRPNPTTPLNRSSPRIPPPTIQLAASEGTFQDTSRADSAGAMNETIHSPSLEDTTSPNPSAVIIDPTSPQPTDQPDLGPLVQHVVIRRDLLEGMKWPVGSVVAQGCHAAVAAIWQHQSDPLVQRYCGDLDRMHKVRWQSLIRHRKSVCTSMPQCVGILQ